MAEIFENDKVFVQGISTKTSQDCLLFYMERISDLVVKDITYGPENGESVNAIVTFGSTIGEFEIINIHEVNLRNTGGTGVCTQDFH